MPSTPLSACVPRRYRVLQQAGAAGDPGINIAERANKQLLPLAAPPETSKPQACALSQPKSRAVFALLRSEQTWGEWQHLLYLRGCCICCIVACLKLCMQPQWRAATVSCPSWQPGCKEQCLILGAGKACGMHGLANAWHSLLPTEACQADEHMVMISEGPLHVSVFLSVSHVSVFFSVSHVSVFLSVQENAATFLGLSDG